VVSSHEVTAARNTGWLNKELSRWTHSLKTMMLDGYRFATEQSKHQRDERGASQMNNMRRADLLPQLQKAGLAENAKRKHGVVKVFGRRLCDNRD